MRLKWETIYLYCLAVWLFLLVFVNMSTIDGYALEVLTMLLGITWMFTRAIIVIKILFQFEVRDLKLIPLILIGLATYCSTGNTWITTIIWLICGAKYVDLDRAVRVIFMVHLVSNCLIVLMAATGIIENTVFYRNDGTVRYAMGYNHPNTFAGIAFQLSALYIYIRNNKINYMNIFLLGVFALGIYRITDSNTSFLLMLCLILFALIIRIINRQWRVLSSILQFAVKRLRLFSAIIAILTLYLIFNYESISGYFKGTMLSRISQASIYFQYYGLSFFGKQLERNADFTTVSSNGLYILDNGYIYLMLGYGVVCFVLYIVGEILLEIRAVKKRDYATLAVLTVYAVHGFSETLMLRFPFNFSLLFLADLLWNNMSWDKQKKTVRNMGKTEVANR